jgi:hypothetical protein
MTKSEELIAAALRNNSALSIDKARQALMENGLIKRGYCIETDLSVEITTNERATLISRFAVLKDGEVYCRASTEQEAQEYLNKLRKSR